ncbi:hypothetical protein BJ986_001749 [Phycicoccus badiiscoriae]|uniref:Uncharacterized protein n=1 Tax=Pedococcus badiiscoriae TaxID=642776 RepID=A0A852WPU1_9MICO|nr:hypothetical protein [Pedococcus badiiscoriae]NYG07262.1 hypothetical protein [Pedococcus badiiscoriae]
MSGKPDREGLSWGYRIGYRIKVLGMHMYGPAQLGDAEDPHRRLERQRAAKVAAARRAREQRGQR